MIKRLIQIDAWPKQVVMLVCIIFVTLVGYVDYLTGYETFFFTFYLLAIFLGAWRVNTAFGILVSALSVTAWISSNIEAGVHYSSYFVPVWNAGIMLTIYVIIVLLLARLRKLQGELEERVRRRTVALSLEIQERRRLQKEILETSDREQRRISRELHDGLCQHLTGTALAGHLLEQKLSANSPAEAGQASRMVQLIEEGIELTRRLSRQLDPVELKTGKLTDHLADLAIDVSQKFDVECHFDSATCDSIDDFAVVTHLYRIALDAVHIAVKQRRASLVNIALDSAAGEIVLSVMDRASDQSEKTPSGPAGALSGMNILAYRADLIGATLKIEHPAANETRVTCALPFPGTPHARKN